MELDLHSIRIIRAIADEGTISGAARRLGYSQPAVSQHLRRVEQRFGVPLAVRSGRGVRLTEAGLIIAKHAVTITSALDAATGDLADLRGLSTGSVRIAAFPTASSTIVPRLLHSLRERHPGISASYVEAEPPEALQMLRDGTVDVAITFAYPGDRADPHRDSTATLETIPLFTEPVVLALPAAHELAAEPVVRLAALRDESWIAGCPLCRGHLLAACEAVGVSPSIALETDNAIAVLNLVAMGLGVALLPQLALATAPTPARTAIRATYPSSDRSIQVVAQAGARRVPSIGAALEVIASVSGADWGLHRSQ